MTKNPYMALNHYKMYSKPDGLHGTYEELASDEYELISKTKNGKSSRKNVGYTCEYKLLNQFDEEHYFIDEIDSDQSIFRTFFFDKEKAKQSIHEYYLAKIANLKIAIWHLEQDLLWINQVLDTDLLVIAIFQRLNPKSHIHTVFKDFLMFSQEKRKIRENLEEISKAFEDQKMESIVDDENAVFYDPPIPIIWQNAGKKLDVCAAGFFVNCGIFLPTNCSTVFLDLVRKENSTLQEDEMLRKILVYPVIVRLEKEYFLLEQTKIEKERFFQGIKTFVDTLF